MHHRPASELCGACPSRKSDCRHREAVRAMPLNSGTRQIIPATSRKWVPVGNTDWDVFAVDRLPTQRETPRVPTVA
jgi:hypothetical protein